jgi:hypothetical protein
MLITSGNSSLLPGSRMPATGITMPLLAAEIPAKLSSSQLSRPTADVTVALEAIAANKCSHNLRFKSTTGTLCGPGFCYNK